LKYKLLALDMDGTLLNSDKEISEANRTWIRRAADAGVMVCIATGRGRDSIAPYIEQLGLETPFVAINGSEVWRNADQLYSRKLIAPNIIARLHRLAVEHELWYWAYGVSGVYNKDNWVRDLNREDWMKFCYHIEDEATLSHIAEEISTWGNLEASNSDPRNIEYNPLGVTKATGLRELCELVGFQMADIVAVGDSLNDLAMIQEAGLGIAMGNAQDAVKRAADTVALSNDEDGVAEIIQRYILSE